MEYLLRSN